MGSATRSATASVRKALGAVLPTRLETADALLGAAAVIGSSSQLRSTLSNPAEDSSTKEGLLSAVFGRSFDKVAQELLVAVVSSRWSSEADVVAAIEDLGIRSAASSAPQSGLIESEIFAFASIVAGDSDLELALGSKLGDPNKKSQLARRLLTGASASPATVAIVSALVGSPRGRRIGSLLRHAASTVADQGGRIVASVTSATELAPAALATVSATVEKLYSKPAILNVSVDPSALGGVRIQVGNDVIDGSIAARIADLRIRLAG